ncbi:ABC transporter substrate-binding protein [Sneathiella marina]|uniref:ABC transporter substrate-binding protein n=1 Tax=Sneathiella marina TaxID=2950108 RepID=A0ABY4W2J3_9PROT|nr:ABC transporter substrate-binding protein [Sneathiella marina]USG61278.1 ABC transporter substrate-binding protein [Sneathiella marina]
MIKKLCESARPILLAAFCLGASLEFSRFSYAETGISDTEILFGQSAAIEGPASALGQGMRDGILAAFHEANEMGGVHGRRLALKSYDDGYDPGKAIENVNQLLEVDKVFALIGGVGTPTAKAVQPIATHANIPFIAPFTGAAFLRDPALRNVVNVRASYEQETEAWIAHLTKDLGITRVAVFYQDDSFGRAGLAGVTKALEKRDLKVVAEGKYLRNTTAIKRALLSIRAGDPQAIAMIGTYKASAKFIKLARQLNIDVVFLNISFVGSKALATELDGNGEKVYVTQVVPFPTDNSIPLVVQYKKSLRNLNSSLEPGFVSLEGYIAGKLVVAILQRLGNKPTREGFIDQIDRKAQFELGGIDLVFGPDDNQGMEGVFLTEILAGGKYNAIEELPND